MKQDIFMSLDRRASAVYLADNRESKFAIAFLGFANSQEQLESLKNEAAKLVTNHRKRHPGNARSEATWLTGRDLDTLWLGSISREHYDLVKAKGGLRRWSWR